MAHISPYTNGITSFSHKKYNDLPDPSSPSTKPLSDSYETGNGLNQDQLNLLPTWQELEQSVDWQLYHKKLDFTFNTKELLGANKLTRLMREHKVYHQPYDICPLRQRKSRESYSKSCEPRSTANEASQTDFDLAAFASIKPLAQDRSSHVRRSSSLSNKSPYSNLQNELYGVDSSRINYSIRNSYISPGRKDNSPGDDLHNLTIPSEKNTPDSFYRDIRDIGVSPRIEQSNLSTRDSVGVGLPHVPSKFAKEKYSVGQIQNFKHVNGSFETNNENFSSNRNVVNPKILIIDSGINDYDSSRHANIKNDINNQRDTSHFNLDYIVNSGGSGKREIIENNKDNEEEYSYRYKSSDRKSFGDEQKAGILKKKNITKVETKQNDNDRIRGLNNAKFKFIGDSEANKDKAHDISRLLNDDSSENKTYSNRNIIDIQNLLKPQLIEAVLEYPDLVILQGELMKYKPGIHFSYVKRWVEITSTELRYYKNRIRANTLETTPILIIPIQDIKAVYRVNIKLPKKIKQEGSSKGLQKLEPVLYHFEVFTNNHPLPSPNELDVTVHTDISAIHDKSMLFPPESGFNANNKSRINESKNSILPASGYRESSHLMPPPPVKKRNEPSQISSIPENCDYEENNLLSGSLLNPRSGYSLKGPSSSLFKNQREQNSAASAYRQGMVRKNTNQISQISEEKDKSGISTKKDPNATTYHYVKTMEDYASWTGRHKEWYDSEKRLLFCSVSKKEREIWLSVINWLIKASNR